MNQYIHFTEYSPVGDIVVMSVCLVMMVLVFFSYFSKTRSSRLFLSIVGLLFLAACADVSFYTLAVRPEHQVMANWLRLVFHILILLIFLYYIAYICEVSHFTKDRPYRWFANLVFFTVLLWDTFVTLQGLTFVVDETGISFIRRGIFIYAYLAFIILCVVLLANVRKLLFHRVMFGFYGTIAISFLVLIIQGISNQSSYTVATLLLPVVAMMYILHSDPYDALLGTNDIKAMQDFVSNNHKKKRDFVFMSLYLKEIEEEGKEIPKDIQAIIRQLTYRFVRKGSLFKIGKGHMVLFFLKKDNPDYKQRAQHIIDDSGTIYDRFT